MAGVRSDDESVATPLGERSILLVFPGIAALIVLVVLGEWVAFADLRPSRILTSTNVASLVSSLPFAFGLAYGGYWLERSPLPPDRYARIVGWCLGGLAVFLGVNLLSIATTPLENLWSLVGWLRWATAIGAGIGFFIGAVEARAIERAAAAERATVRAEEAEERERLLDYLNGLLRHEVLNTANVIEGYAAHLREEHADGAAAGESLDVIERQAGELSDVIADVRVLLAASRGDADLEPVDVTSVVDAEVRNLTDRFDAVEVETSLPGRAVVRGDDLLRRVFSNLLVNAVEHNDGDVAHVTVAVESGPETVTVRVADDGPGIPDADRERLFERRNGGDSDHGIGLALVATLVDRYDGRIALSETGPDGSVFTVEFPRASPGTGDDRDRRSDADALAASDDP